MKSFGNQQSYSINDAVVVCGKPIHSGGRIGERNFEWYDIVDLREWMENKR
jgi:hypothetical protein